MLYTVKITSEGIPLTACPTTKTSNIVISGFDSKTLTSNVKLLSISFHSLISSKGSILIIIVWFPNIFVPLDESQVIKAGLVPGIISSPTLVALSIEEINEYPIKVSSPPSGRS